MSSARALAFCLAAGLTLNVPAFASDRGAPPARHELTPEQRHELKRIQMDAQRRRAAAPTDAELAAHRASPLVPRSALPSVRSIYASDRDGTSASNYPSPGPNCEFKSVMTDDDYRNCESTTPLVAGQQQH